VGGEESEAREVFQRLLQKHPSSPFPHLGLAYVAMYEGHPFQANDHVEEASKRTTDPSFLFDFAWILIESPATRPQGVEFLKRTLQVFPTEPDAHLALAVLREKSAPEEARRHMEQARAHWRRTGKTPEEGAEFLRQHLQPPRPPRPPPERES
jgi:hypothetical protein